jgi:hypothetical protein
MPNPASEAVSDDEETMWWFDGKVLMNPSGYVIGVVQPDEEESVRRLVDLANSVAKMERERDAWKAETIKHRPLADCYLRVCQSLKIENDILGFVKKLIADLAAKDAEIATLRAANPASEAVRVREEIAPESIADRVSREIIALLPPGNMIEPLLRQAAVKAHLAIAALERRVESAERDESIVDRINSLAMRVNTKLSKQVVELEQAVSKVEAERDEAMKFIQLLEESVQRAESAASRQAVTLVEIGQLVPSDGPHRPLLERVQSKLATLEATIAAKAHIIRRDVEDYRRSH